MVRAATPKKVKKTSPMQVVLRKKRMAHLVRAKKKPPAAQNAAPKRGDEAYKNESLFAEEDEGAELEATEDELGAEDKFADEEGDEISDLEAETEGEVTITDEEAQDIIALADKLRDAVGGEEAAPEEVEMEMGEEEVDIEEPGNRGVYEEELYEAALKGLDIELTNDDVQRQQALLQEAKKRIYERVVKRLLQENKKK